MLGVVEVALCRPPLPMPEQAGGGFSSHRGVAVSLQVCALSECFRGSRLLCFAQTSLGCSGFTNRRALRIGPFAMFATLPDRLPYPPDSEEGSFLPAGTDESTWPAPKPELVFMFASCQVCPGIPGLSGSEPELGSTTESLLFDVEKVFPSGGSKGFWLRVPTFGRLSPLIGK